VFALAWPSHSDRKPGHVRRSGIGRVALAVLLGIVLVPGLDLVRVDAGFAAAVIRAWQIERTDGPVAIVPLANIEWTADVHADNAPDHARESQTTAAASTLEACAEIDPQLMVGFQSLRRQIATLREERVRQAAELAQMVFLGTASTYNPYLENTEAEYFETASGELYDPAGWTAAIQIDFRNYFGGVRYGRNYQPVYALIESGGRQAVVKINDVGPLRPGRTIDLNDRSMRYFDPSMQLGLVRDMKVTLLPGDDWKAGPVGAPQPVSVASAE